MCVYTYSHVYTFGSCEKVRTTEETIIGQEASTVSQYLHLHTSTSSNADHNQGTKKYFNKSLSSAHQPGDFKFFLINNCFFV